MRLDVVQETFKTLMLHDVRVLLRSNERFVCTGNLEFVFKAGMRQVEYARIGEEVFLLQDIVKIEVSASLIIVNLRQESPQKTEVPDKS